MTTQLILKPRALRIEDLQVVEISHSPNGRRLSKPLTLTIPSAQSKGEQGLQQFVIDAFSWKMSALIEFTLRSKAATELAKRIMLSNSGSKATLYQYMYGVYRYCKRIRQGPDQLIGSARGSEGEVIPKVLSAHAKSLDDFVGELRAEGLAPGTISNYVKGVRALYRANALQLELPYKLSRRVVYRDRSPRREELQRLLDVADLREKVIISMLALGGFREGTLVRLQHRHVKEDLEKSVVPIHVHVESEITKGKYTDYDTFLGEEVAEYLRLYLDVRRRGSPEMRTPPETIMDESPLIRDSHSRRVAPITPGRVHNLLHNLYREAGLIKDGNERRYELRVHSLRKFFRTQLSALGVNAEYIEYMMGHVTSTYHDVESLGVERLRSIYASANLSIKPKATLSKVEIVKEMVRGVLSPEDILKIEMALSEPDTKYVDPEERERAEIRALSNAFKEQIRREILDSLKEPQRV